MKKRKLKVGSVYRVFTVYTATEEKTGYYMDVLCTSEEGAAKILKCNPKEIKSFKSGDWFVGGHTAIGSKYVELIANSIEEYSSSLLDNIPPKAIVYNTTFIDLLYITYCKLLGRETDEFV